MQCEEKTPKSIRLWMVLTILVTMCLMSTVVFQHLMHIRLVEEVTELKSELRVLTMKSRNPFSMNWVSKREKRQVGLADIKAAEKSGVNVLDRAYQYGNDLNSESALSVYRTLMGELLYDDDESFGDGNNGQNGRENSNSYGESSSNQGNSNAQSGQSSYARTVCVNVTDVQTNTGLSNVTFFFSQNGRPAFKTIDEDGSICFKTLTTGTTLEVTVVKDRYNNATKIDTVTTDTDWTISLTPLGYDHNQLGILRESSSNQGNSNPHPPQSSYARVSGNDDTNCNPYGPNVELCRMQRVNPHPSAHRHSRVASTPEVEVTTQTYIVPEPITLPKPMKSPKSMLKSLDSSRMFDTIGSPILSIHLQAKVSSDSADPSSTDLETGVHNSWRLSPWSKKLHGAGLFIADEEEGQIEVPEAGLYLVYAQIEYMDVSETNGFEVDLDSEAVLSCVVTTSGTDDSEKKHNTCFTSATLFLQRGALLNVRDKEAGRYSLLHSKGTFFGITKISSC